MYGKISLILLLIASAPVFSSASFPLVPSQINQSDELNLKEKEDALNEIFSSLTLTEDEKSLLRSYSSSRHALINGSLRQIAKDSLKELAPEICELDKATKSFQIQGFTLFRGHNYLPINSDQVGYIHSDNAFMSTSLSRNNASFYAFMKAPAVLDVIETGLQPVEGIWLAPVSIFEYEREFLIQRNSNFEVTKVEKMGELTVRYLRPMQKILSPEIDTVLNCK